MIQRVTGIRSLSGFGCRKDKKDMYTLMNCYRKQYILKKKKKIEEKKVSDRAKRERYREE